MRTNTINAGPAVNFWEFTRFLLSGGVATLGNICTVWILRSTVSYGVAVIWGICAGATISFFMAKYFAFRSRSLAGTGGEAFRFLVIYGFGLVLYWGTAVVTRAMLSARTSSIIADTSGVLAGAALMAVTGYFGHRFFTYPKHLR
jgi:putative flippase GtrA